MNKKGGLVVLIVITMLVITSQVAFGQVPTNTQNLMTTAANQVNSSWTSFKNLMTYICGFIAAGAFLYAGYTAFFDSQRMRHAMVALISGILILAIGGAMGYLG